MNGHQNIFVCNLTMGAALLPRQRVKKKHTHTESNKCIDKKIGFLFVRKTYTLNFFSSISLSFSFSSPRSLIYSSNSTRLSHNVHCVLKKNNKYTRWVFFTFQCVFNALLSAPQVEFDFSFSLHSTLLFCSTGFFWSVHSPSRFLFDFVRQMFEYAIKRHRYYYNQF